LSKRAEAGLLKRSVVVEQAGYEASAVVEQAGYEASAGWTTYGTGRAAFP
jgi:hypothetical protein